MRVSPWFVVIGGLAIFGGFVLFGHHTEPTGATVTHWAQGQSEVTGTVHNGGGRGCSDMQVTLTLTDQNQALVRNFTFGAGEVADGQTKNFTTKMVGLLFIDQPVEASVRQITAGAACADQVVR